MKDKDKKLKADIWDKYDIDKTLAKFVTDEPFYSHISANINKYKTNSLDTAGVTVDEDGRLILLYNEDFFNSLNWRHKQGLLIHEFLHLIFNHATSRVKLNKNGEPDKAWFFACDFSINSLIDESRLPEGGLLPGRWQEIPPSQRKLYSPEKLQAIEQFREMVMSWPKEQSADWYYKRICENRQVFDDLEQNNNINLTDDHGGWRSNMSSEEQEILDNHIKNIIKEATELCDRDCNWGTVPEHFQSEIKKMLDSYINWQSLLKHFIGNSRNIHFSSTIKKINKRYPYVHPGKKRSRTARIVVCVDQSGSVDEKTLSRFFGELDKLASYTEFVVVPFDAKVVEKWIFTWKKGQKLNPKRVARGGTNFNVPTAWVNENFSKFDAALFMTDGYCSQPISCKIPRAWIICPTGKLNFSTNELVIPMNQV